MRCWRPVVAPSVGNKQYVLFWHFILGGVILRRAGESFFLLARS